MNKEKQWQAAMKKVKTLTHVSMLITTPSLFYSLDAEGILEHYKDFEITEIEFQILKKFDEQFCDFYGKNNWPKEFIDTKEWAKIMNLAKDVLKAFDYQKK